MTFVCLLCYTVMLLLMVFTAKPLREFIFVQIFHEIGANFNSVENYKARTAFFGTVKVDFVTHCLYLNTLAFLCYEFTL